VEIKELLSHRNFWPLYALPKLCVHENSYMYICIYHYGTRDLRAYKLRQRLSLCILLSLSSPINRSGPLKTPQRQRPHRCQVPSSIYTPGDPQSEEPTHPLAAFPKCWPFC